jgi:demethylmenaquinone methyltransferase/2-methoxy-6-polyprenyl-1,4-benzoquinol methylase
MLDGGWRGRIAEMYYDPQHRAERVKALFGQIAPRYDLINSIQSIGLHKFWKRRVLKLANLSKNDRALDVCCGTGDIALCFARSGANVTGIDFSEPMLEIARSRGRVEKTNPPQFLAGDAQQLPFADETFDVVTCGYGLRNLEDWETGLREMHRVTRKGGKIITLDFGKPSASALRAVYYAYLRVMVPFFGLVFCGDAAAYAYILESLKHFPAQRGIFQNMKDLNMEQVRMINLVGGAMAINYGEKKSSQ